MSRPHDDRYRFIEVIGQGSMGVVWRAEDEVLGRTVAIKELAPSSAVDAAEATDRFLFEARAAARLTHPNILAVYDLITDNDRVLISMELIDGPTLAQVVRWAGAQPAPTVRAIMSQVAQGLAAAHDAGVVHRDLKPENVFWTPEGRVVVADFGVARIGLGRDPIDGWIIGTPGYMAPEQAQGISVGPPADVFGWGAIAFELATGRPPWEDVPLYVRDDPVLEELIGRSLSEDPAQRPRDGAELVRELTQGQGARPAAVRTNTRVGRYDRRHLVKQAAQLYLEPRLRRRLRRTLAVLESFLWLDEGIHWLAGATRDGVFGVLAVTDVRILFVADDDDGWCSLDELVSAAPCVSGADGMFGVLMCTPSETVAFLDIGDSRRVQELIRSIRRPLRAVPFPLVQAVERLTELRDQRILTPAEFEAALARTLDRDNLPRSDG